jgi:hypothetical protein
VTKRLLTWGIASIAALACAPPALAASATTGLAHKSTASAAPAPRSAAAVRASKGARRRPGSAAATRTAAAPRAASTTITAALGDLLVNFNGVSSRDSEVTNFGAKFEPPDQGLCVGNGFVVEMVNSAYTVYRPNGSKVTGPFNVNGPFNEGLVEFTTDPRCHYDPATNTWFAVVAFISDDNQSSHLDLAVNASGDPTTRWTNYEIDTTGLGGSTGPRHPGCPCFGDQPKLGIDSENVYLTTTEFSILGPEFNGDQIYAVAKSDLVEEADSIHFVHFTDLNIGGAPAFSVEPALTYGSPPAEFFLSSLDPNGTFDQRIGVWAMTHRERVATGGKPTLSSKVIRSEGYAIPPPAEQKGSDSTLESGDDRMQQVQYIGGNVLGSLDTSVTIPNDPQPRAGVAWFKVKPTVANNVLTGATLAAQGYVALRGNHLLYGAFQADPAGNAAMAFTLTGPSRFPSAAYATLPPGGRAFGPVKVAAAGTTFYDPDATRWGDYSWAVLDPTAKRSIWLATEYIPPRSSQTSDKARNWGTRVFQVATR